MLHPLVKQLSPSPEQEPAIIDRGRDVVVTAGAGTGKTRTLVARYLALLSEDVPLRQIVAITFTQKAAREMRNRVREAIRDYIGDPGLKGAERSFWQRRYSELDAARISTIHSLCAEILYTHPAEAGVDPRFEVLDEGGAALLQTQAVEEALAWAADNMAQVSLFALLGEGALRDTLTTLLKQRLDIQSIFASLPVDLMSHWGQILTGRQQQILTTLTSDEGWLAWVELLRTNAANDPTDKLEIQRQAALAAIDGATGTLAGQLASLASLSELNLTGGAATKWPQGKVQVTEVKTALRALRDLWKEQAPLLTLTLTDHDEALVQAVPALRQLFDFARGRYTDLKNTQNVLDFDDLEQQALALFRQHETVRNAWQKAVRAILIDEFQDTNARQRDLLAYLNGGEGKLFIVGDAKQSIYRFRGADVTVFRQERETIEGEGGVHFPLSTSYRAHQALLVGMNHLLRPVLGDAPNPQRPWAEPFAPLKPHRQQPGAGFEAPHIELHLAVGGKSEGALGRAADVLARRLIALVEDGETQVGIGPQARRITYGDIAILCRASTSFGAYEDALERAGVPFLTVAGRGFYQRAEIRDLLNALQALADPTDDLVLAGLLRSPALALSDEALYRLAQARETSAGSLWETLQSNQVQLSSQDTRRASRAVKLIQVLHGQVGRTTVADLLKAFLDATSYRAALIQAGQPRAARNVAKLLADAHDSRIVSVSEFLAYVSGLRDVGAREGEARATAEGVVQIMSVHAAKGLEFPVVVIGDITYQTPNRYRVLLDPHLGLLLPQKDEAGELSASYRLGKGQADDQEAAELDRLLYVAATRAEEKLLLSGCVSLKKDGRLGNLGGWLRKLAGEDVLGLAEAAIQYDETDPQPQTLDLQIEQTPVACYIYSPAAETGLSTYTIAPEPEWPTPLPPPFLKPITAPPPKLPLERNEPQRVWRVVPAVERPRAPAWVVGKLVHSALALWRFPDDGFDNWAAAQARNLGLTDERQVTHALVESRRLLHRFQAHPLYHTMAQANQRLHEVPYSLTIAGQIEAGVIDALFLQDGIWTIVEFKTDQIRDETQRDALLTQTDYLSQVNRYRQAVKHLLSQEPQYILCWLNYKGQIDLQNELALQAIVPGNN